MSTEPVGLSAETAESLQTDTQRAVAAIWADVLKKNFLELDDDFFLIGGNSMSATLVTYRLRDDFDLDLPLMLIFENSTIEELADAVDELVAREKKDD